MRAGLAALLVGVTSAAPEAAEVPQPTREDARVMFVNYSPNQVVRVIGGIRTSTQIEFGADETIVSVAIGNTIAWEVSPVENFLFLKPREQHPHTNLQVLTSRKDGLRRSYQIEIATLDGEAAKRTPPMLAVRFRYPADEALRRQTEAIAKGDATKAGEASRRLAASEGGLGTNFNYSVQGETPFEPVAVWDNGKLTTFEFKGNIEMPAIYLAREEGGEELVPKNVVGNKVQVHALAAKFVLRRGDEVMCIWNEDFRPEGVDPGTKTTSAAVGRTVKTVDKTAAVPVVASARPALGTKK